jgi:hypothetical protein
MYAPQLGRFISRDPAGYVDGMNMYQFVASNPGLRTDPFGLAGDPPLGPLQPGDEQMLAQGDALLQEGATAARINAAKQAGVKAAAIYAASYAGAALLDHLFNRRDPNAIVVQHGPTGGSCPPGKIPYPSKVVEMEDYADLSTRVDVLNLLPYWFKQTQVFTHTLEIWWSCCCKVGKSFRKDSTTSLGTSSNVERLTLSEVHVTTNLLRETTITTTSCNDGGGVG